MAAENLLVECGYASVTIDGIAARAGVGKQTIYRWWPTKADVILEVTAGRDEFAVPVEDLGSYAKDLRMFLTRAFTMASGVHTAELLRGLMVESQLRADFGERFRTTFLEPRRDAFAEIVLRAGARGDPPQGLSPDTASDIVFGTLWYRLLTARQEVSMELIDDLVRVLS